MSDHHLVYQIESDAPPPPNAPQRGLWDKLADNPLWRWIAFFGVFFLSCAATWQATASQDLWFRIIFTVTVGLCFLWTATNWFVPTTLLFGIIGLMTLLSKGFMRFADRYSIGWVIGLGAVIAIVPIWFYYHYERMRKKCEKCGWTLHDDHLLDDETVSIYRCPNPRCKHINYERWPERPARD